MKTEKILLILGLVFSIFLITFRIHNGFELLGFKVAYSLYDHAMNSSSETYLTSSVLGYFFYLLFGILMWSKVHKTNRIILITFLLLIILGMFFELKVIIESISNPIKGAHFRIGLLLAIIGFGILLNKKRLSDHKNQH